MSSSLPDESANNGRRLTALEELVTHFERTIQDLNEALLGQQQQITALERRVTQLVAELASVADKTPEPPRRLEDDKPPHY